MKSEHLPFLSCLWISENKLMTAGHDCVPVLYGVARGQITKICKLDFGKKAEVSGKFNAMQRFKSLDRNATTEKANDPLDHSLHKNSVTQLQVHSGTKSETHRITTSGMDGLLVIWDLTSIEGAMNGLHIQ
jgi:actin related protein 2/3 complex subunit 1A/1B